MATKITRVCDRLGCIIEVVEGNGAKPGSAVSFTVTKQVNGKQEVLLHWDEICSMCEATLTGLMSSLRTKKTAAPPGRTPKAAAKAKTSRKAAAADKEEPRTPKKRGRPSNAERAARAAEEQQQLKERIAQAQAAQATVVEDSEEEEERAGEEEAPVVAATPEEYEFEEEEIETFEAENGDIVNAATGEVIGHINKQTGKRILNPEYSDNQYPF